MTGGILLNVAFPPVLYSSLFMTDYILLELFVINFSKTGLFWSTWYICFYSVFLFHAWLALERNIQSTLNVDFFWRWSNLWDSFSPPSMVYISSVLHTIRTTWKTCVLDVLLHLALKISCFWCDSFLITLLQCISLISCVIVFWTIKVICT